MSSTFVDIAKGYGRYFGSHKHHMGFALKKSPSSFLSVPLGAELRPPSRLIQIPGDFLFFRVFFKLRKFFFKFFVLFCFVLI